MSDDKTVIIKQAIADGVVKLKYWWKGDKHSLEIGTDCCGNELEYDPLVKSIPTTSTFHHLGHEGKVFIHSDRHDDVANAATDDILIRIPSGNSARQVHLRWFYKGRAVTGTLDVDVSLYKDSEVSADGDAEDIVSNNDANVKSTEVLMFHNPTVTDVGTIIIQTAIIGENKGTGSDEVHLPEYICAPNGESERNYIMRVTNNSGGNLDYVPALFFYDSEAK